MAQDNNINLLKDELKFIIELEQKELEEFSKLIKETIKDIDKTKKELNLEEKIKLNLKFINYKLTKIHKGIESLKELTKKLDIEKDLVPEINHRIKFRGNK